MSVVAVRNQTKTSIVVPDALAGSVTIDPGASGVVRLAGTGGDQAFWSLVARGLIHSTPMRRAA